MKTKKYIISPPSRKALLIKQSIVNSGVSDSSVITVDDVSLYKEKDSVGEGENIYFLISEDQNKNCLDALELAYKCNPDDKIYLSSNGSASELLIDNACKETGIIVRRINTARYLVYKNLYDNSMFDLASDIDDEKVITIVIIGCKDYGKEMLKACLWCGQMDGFLLKIHIIDNNPKAETEFYYDAPEIKKRNRLPRLGEDYYDINFHYVDKWNTEEFVKNLEVIEKPSWVFISTENNMESLEIAIKCREIYAKQQLENDYVPMHYSDSVQMPFIQVIISDDAVSNVINSNGLENYKKQKYGINAIGSESTIWNIDNICNTGFETMALEMHLKWGDEESFNEHEYYRRSSIATAIHKKYRDIFYPEDDVMKDVLEHKRWAAYMRATEGFSFGLLRDDLAKQHNCLTKYNNLSKVEKNKDKRMNSGV